MIGRPTRCEGRNAVEAELGKIQSIDEDIDRPYRISDRPSDAVYSPA